MQSCPPLLLASPSFKDSLSIWWRWWWSDTQVGGCGRQDFVIKCVYECCRGLSLGGRRLVMLCVVFLWLYNATRNNTPTWWWWFCGLFGIEKLCVTPIPTWNLSVCLCLFLCVIQSSIKQMTVMWRRRMGETKEKRRRGKDYVLLLSRVRQIKPDRDKHKEMMSDPLQLAMC